MKYALMTQDDCPRCEIMKGILNKPLKGAYNDKIQIVHKQSDPDRFEELRKEYSVSSTPQLINLETQELISDVSNGLKIKKFLES